MLKKYFWLLNLIVFLSAGCAGQDSHFPALLKTGKSQSLNQRITLLPLLDSRAFPQTESKPVMSRGAPIIIDPSLVKDECLTAWVEQGFADSVVLYDGAMPETTDFKWSDFPLRDLEADLAVGLELKNLNIKVTGFNALMVPQALSNSLVLPLFAAGSVLSNGSFDLTGRIIPSLQVKYSGLVEINFISRLAGGLVFSKIYLADLTDWSVSESQVYSGFLRSPSDGQELGRKNAPKVLGDLFVTAARDPELGFLPLFIRAAWLDRVLSSTFLDAGLKADLVVKMTDVITPPSWTAQEVTSMAESGKSLLEKTNPFLGWDKEKYSTTKLNRDLADYYNVDPAWIQDALGRCQIFESAAKSFMEQAGRLQEIKMSRPLTPEEKLLDVDIDVALSKWGRERAANLLFRDLFSTVKHGSGMERVLIKLLNQAPVEFGNQELLRNKSYELLEKAAGGSDEDKKRAISFLIAWEGAHVLDRPLEKRLVLEQLSGIDKWAAQVVMANLRKKEGPDRESIRLAGAMGLSEACPILADLALKKESPKVVMELSRVMPEIPVTVTAALARESGLETDRIAAAAALGCFPDQPRAARALRRLADRWRTEEKMDAVLAAEAIKSLGLLKNSASLPLIFDIWVDGLMADKDAFLVRRAALKAFQHLSGPEFYSSILKSVEPLTGNLTANQTQLNEIIDFFGETRYGPAVNFLAEIARRNDAEPTLASAAIVSLGLIAIPEAEEVLKELAESPRLELAQGAKKALEAGVLERSLLEGLDIYTGVSSRPDKENS